MSLVLLKKEPVSYIPYHPAHHCLFLQIRPRIFLEREETISVEYIAREHERWDVKIEVVINWGDEEVRELKRWEGDREVDKEEQPFENVLRQRIKYETYVWEHVSER